MWLFTKYGFYSATVSREDPGKMQIRARSKRDLENLIDFAASFGWNVGEYMSEIITTPKADYRYRVICSQNRWADIAGMLARDIDYSNFKAQISDPERHSLYERIWGIMAGLQGRASWAERLSDAGQGRLDLGEPVNPAAGYGYYKDREEDNLPGLPNDLGDDDSGPFEEEDMPGWSDEEDDPTDPFYVGDDL